MAKYKQIEKILSERNKLRKELIQIKEEKLCGQKQIFQENTKLKTKLFLTEQKLQKTQNLYEILKKKIKKKEMKEIWKMEKLQIQGVKVKIMLIIKRKNKKIILLTRLFLMKEAIMIWISIKRFLGKLYRKKEKW